MSACAMSSQIASSRCCSQMHEIAEGDEGSSSDLAESSEDNGLEGLDEDQPLEITGGIYERRKDSLSGRSFKDDAMMFDLDGDNAGGSNFKAVSVSPQPTACVAAFTSPSQGSQQESSNSSSYSSRYTENVANLISAGTPLASIRTVAQSVHVTDGYMWRMNTHRRQQRKQSSIRKQKLTSPQAYPPKVVMALSSLPSGPINFAEFDEKGWDRFKQELLLLIDANIKSGKWQASREGTGGVAMSCPRF